MENRFDRLMEKAITNYGKTASRRDTLSKLWNFGLAAMGLQITGILLPINKAFGSHCTNCNATCGSIWCGGEGNTCPNNSCLGAGATCSGGGAWSICCSACNMICQYTDCCCTGSCTNGSWCGPGCYYAHAPSHQPCPNGGNYCCTVVTCHGC